MKSLKLRRGDDAIAVIESTEVMIARSGDRHTPNVDLPRHKGGRDRRR
jgi:hypothetical protein